MTCVIACHVSGVADCLIFIYDFWVRVKRMRTKLRAASFWELVPSFLLETSCCNAITLWTLPTNLLCVSITWTSVIPQPFPTVANREGADRKYGSGSSIYEINSVTPWPLDRTTFLLAFTAAKVARYNILILDRGRGIHSASHLTFTVSIFVQAT